jgi:sigma-B regulation protein RsbU (phosphoserine phosphatase)
MADARPLIVPNHASVLVVEDDPVSSAQLSALARAAGYQVSVAQNGRAAWDALQRTRFRVVISDWYMPELDGVELCRRVRARHNEPYVYFILVTSRGGKKQYLAGMQAGADDFIAKPVDPDELQARLGVAERILGLRRELQQLEVLLPICSYCRRIRNEHDEWESLETYIEHRFETQFTHSVCPDCYVKHVQPQLDRQERET